MVIDMLRQTFPRKRYNTVTLLALHQGGCLCNSRRSCLSVAVDSGLEENWDDDLLQLDDMSPPTRVGMTTDSMVIPNPYSADMQV